jgi:hypothetical protein
MLIGVDCGKTGGVAFLFSNGEVEAFPMPLTSLDLVQLLEVKVEQERKICGIKTMPNIRAVVESVNAMPSGGRKMGATAAFSFGRSFEMPQSIFSALRIPYSLVSAVTWQKVLKCKKAKEYKDRKNLLYRQAQQLFPQVFEGALIGYGKAIADALLILEYGRIQKLDSIGG